MEVKLCFVRNTLSGSEWWDSENKKVVSKPYKHFTNEVIGVIEKVENQENTKTDIEELQETTKEKSGNAGTAELTTAAEDNEVAAESIFDSMTVRELKDYATNKGIGIPKTVKSKKEVATFLENEKELRDQ